MPSRSRIIVAGAVLTLAAGAVLFGCSKDDNNPAAPPTGAPTLNIQLAANGGSGSAVFSNAGTFAYKCGIHPNIMFGNTVVVDPNETATLVTVNVTGTVTPGFIPSLARVKVGGTVRWVNPDGMPHSVVND